MNHEIRWNQKNSPLVESPVGLIPRNWKVKRLSEACERVSVGIASAATHAYAPSGIPLIRNQNIKEGFIDPADMLFITPEFDEEYKGKRLRAGDVLTVRTGYPGISAVVPMEFESCQSFTTLISRPNLVILKSEYLCHWINSTHGKAFVAVGKAGAAQQNLNAGMLEQMLLPLPPLDEQEDICDFIDELLRTERLLVSLCERLYNLQDEMREALLKS